MNDILFVTAFKDIGRSNWTTHKRSNQEYFNYFLNITNNKILFSSDRFVMTNIRLQLNIFVAAFF